MSALIGTPPNNRDDYLIARGCLLRAASIDPSLYKLDPAKGAMLPPRRPSPALYVPESRTVPTLVGGIVCTVLILAVTGCRLYVRSGNAKLRFGKDDWMIIPAVVSLAASYVHIHPEQETYKDQKGYWKILTRADGRCDLADIADHSRCCRRSR